MLLRGLHELEQDNTPGLAVVPRLLLPRRTRLQLHWWVTALIFSDLLGIIVISAAIFNSYVESPDYGKVQFWAVLGAFVVAWGLASHAQSLYAREVMLAGRGVLLTRAIMTCVLAFGFVMLLAFALKFIGGVSRLWLLGSAAGAVSWVSVTRLLFRQRLEGALRDGGCLQRALVLCDTPDVGYRISDALERESFGEIRVTAITTIPGISGPGVSGTSDFTPVESQIRSGAIDRVFVSGFDERVAETNALLSRLAQFAVDVTLLPNYQGLRAPLIRVARIGPLPAVDVVCKPLSPVEAFLKRTEDLVLGGIILLLAAPAMVLIALAVKLDSRGPVFFRQARLGFHDKAFSVWKFRTMHPSTEDTGVLRQTGRHDDRVTRVGRILRRTSLDELPQLFNVLSGEMSIVGPRPHAKTMTTAGLPLHLALEGYSSRHRIKPGITGWAQINGCRGEVNTEVKLRQRVDLDCHYIENWSIALDAWIIMKTILLIVFDQDAY